MYRNAQRGKIQKTIAIGGIAGPLMIIIGSLAAIMVSASWFSWLSNHISDLGHPFMVGGSQGTSGINSASIFFNGGLIIGGFVILLFAFLLILYEHEQSSRLGILGCSVLATGSIFLVLVGIFNESAGILHFLVSAMFFVCLLLGGLLYGARLIQTPDTRLIGYIAIISAVISGILWVISFGFPQLAPWTAFAIPETFSVLTSFLWMGMLSIRILKS